MQVRTRFAPSPTGSLHVGNARIAALNWLFARRQGGHLLLRIEDTDAGRNVRDAELQIFEDLRWLGLDWDEGPRYEGRPADSPLGPFHQSQRLASYREAAERLRAAGLAYDCWCTPAEIEAMRERAIERGEPARYDGRCRHLTSEQVAAYRREGRGAALRFTANNEGQIMVGDAVRGVVSFDAAVIGDFVLLRADGMPTYNFAVVVDDIAMQISHVIRGAGHLSNTPRQILLYEALNVEPPVFAHVPMILSPARQVLSKRHGARALAEYRAEGVHPDALLNYLSLLSWSSPSGDEVLTRERLIAEVSLERIGASDAVFDETKLHWLSQQHIAAMPRESLVEAIRPYVEEQAAAWALERLPLLADAVRTRLTTFGDIGTELQGFSPPRDAHSAAPANASEAATLRTTREHLRTVDAWTPETLHAAIRAAGRECGARGPALFHPLRRALTGQEQGPALPLVMHVRGREDTLASLALALDKAGAA
jgi:glutamyl-tRNA synthetase